MLVRPSHGGESWFEIREEPLDKAAIYNGRDEEVGPVLPSPVLLANMTVEYLAPLDGESLKDVSGYPDTAVDTVPVGSQAGRKMETSLIKDAFNGLSAFGFAFAVLGTWSSLVVGLGSGLAAGGPSSRT